MLGSFWFQTKWRGWQEHGYKTSSEKIGKPPLGASQLQGTTLVYVTMLVMCTLLCVEFILLARLFCCSNSDPYDSIAQKVPSIYSNAQTDWSVQNIKTKESHETLLGVLGTRKYGHLFQWNEGYLRD